MSNEETLQEYNTNLAENNDTLDVILNMVNNLPEGGSGGASNIFSTVETRIGTWIDGKPLYRKVVSTTEVMDEDVNLVVPHGITDIDKIWIDFGNSYYYRAEDKRGLTLIQTFYTTTQSQDRTSAYVDENNVHLISTGGWNENWEKVITLNYTKTTDTGTEVN